MNNIKYVFSGKFLTSDYRSGIFINQETSEEFEVSDFFLSLLGFFEKPTSIDDLILSNKMNTSDVETWKEIVSDLVSKGILIKSSFLLEKGLYTELTPDTCVSSFIAQVKLTMFGCPSVRLDSLKKGNFIIYGLPIDIGCTEKNGTKFGPQTMRRVSTIQYSYVENLIGIPRGVSDEKYGNLMSGVKIKDLGDILFFPGESPKDYTSKIIKISKILSRRGCIPVAIGGDHSISYGAIAGILKKDDDFVILHFDAHTDLGELYKNRHHHHGNVFARVLRDFPNSRIAQFGIRGQAGQKPDNGNRYLLGSTQDVDVWDTQWRKFIKPKSKVYVSIDIDVTDPFYAPGVGTPVRNGITPESLIESLRLMVSTLTVVV